MLKPVLTAIFRVFFTVGLLFGSAGALADSVVRQNPGDDLKQEAEKGWFFYKGPVKPDEPELSAAANKPQQKKKEDPCKEPAKWKPSCGFIDPGSDFAFQEKQRDALMQNMVMNPASSKAVEDFQFYNKWVVDKATAAANMWQYNLAQNPNLDPAVNAPISQFALQLATDVKKAESQDIYEYLAANGMLLYFTRSDCVYCHAMADLAKDLGSETGIPLWNISLDKKCLNGFQDKCLTSPESIRPAQALQVATVPTIFLYVKPNTWIRVSTGVVPLNTIKGRIVSFVTAYRAAVLAGAGHADGGRPAVDFTKVDSLGGNAKGVSSGPETKAALPTSDEMERILKAVAAE